MKIVLKNGLEFEIRMSPILNLLQVREAQSIQWLHASVIKQTLANRYHYLHDIPSYERSVIEKILKDKDVYTELLQALDKVEKLKAFL